MSDIRTLTTHEYARVEEPCFIHVQVRIEGHWRCVAKYTVTPPDTRESGLAEFWAMIGLGLRPRPEHRLVDDCDVCRKNAEVP